MASGGKIQTYSKRIIEHCCRELLVQNYDPDACEHPDAGDQIREVLIRRNYVAQKDIESCCCLDVSGMVGEAAIADLRAPRDVFVKTCDKDETAVQRIEVVMHRFVARRANEIPPAGIDAAVPRSSRSGDALVSSLGHPS